MKDALDALVPDEPEVDLDAAADGVADQEHVAVEPVGVSFVPQPAVDAAAVRAMLEVDVLIVVVQVAEEDVRAAPGRNRPTEDEELHRVAIGEGCWPDELHRVRVVDRLLA